MYASADAVRLSPPLPYAKAALLLALSLLLHALAWTALREGAIQTPSAQAVAARTIDASLILERPVAPVAAVAPTPRPRPKPRTAPPPTTSQAQTAAAPASEATPAAEVDPPPTGEEAGREVAQPEPTPAPASAAAEIQQPPRGDVADLAMELAEVGGALSSLPAAATYTYRMSDSRYPSFTGSTAIEWRVDAAVRRYEARLRTTVLDVPILEVTSSGVVQRFGLAPERYVQKTATRAALAVNIDWARRAVTFSRRSDERGAREGLQDRLSFQFQLMALAQNLPHAFADGATVSMPVASTSDVERYDFVVVGRETLQLATGPVQTIKLDRAKGAGVDTRVEAWLAPERRWLPVKLRFTDRRGNVTESLLESAHEGG